MKFICIGVSVTQVASGGVKEPVYNVSLEPAEGGPPIRINGGAGSAVATMSYGAEIEISAVAPVEAAEAAEPAEPTTPAEASAAE